MTLFCRTRRMMVAVVAGGALAGGAAASARALTPPVLALAYGVGATPTPTPPPTPTPTPTPTVAPTPTPSGPKTYKYPADGSFVSVVLPAGWTAITDRGGNFLCAPSDPAEGYLVTLSTAGSFSGPENAKSYLSEVVKTTLAGAKMGAAKNHPLQTGRLGSGTECLIEVVDGKLAGAPTSYVFMCFAPVPGRYVLLVARGRTDKLNATGFDVVGAMADSIKGL